MALLIVCMLLLLFLLYQEILQKIQINKNSKRVLCYSTMINEWKQIKRNTGIALKLSEECKTRLFLTSSEESQAIIP